MIGLALFFAAFVLAFSNGANDNFKGVASLYGSGTTSYLTALLWGTAATLLGSFAAILLARGLMAAFSGSGVVPDAVAGGQRFLLSVATGAAMTVLLASRLGFPISTTHSLLGGIMGAGYLATGHSINLEVLTSTFVAPLIFSPVLAVGLSGLLYLLLHSTRVVLGVGKDTCICLGTQVAAPVANGTLALHQRTPAQAGVSVDSADQCEERYHGHLVGIEWQRVMDVLHFLSAGIVSFARGLNDTPKIAALLLVLTVVSVPGAMILVGMGMAAGGLLAARRVALTMGRRITAMNHGQGLAANLTTGFLVIMASRLGLPVSTTHVSVGSLFGIGLATRQGNLPVIRNVILSWVVTLPCAAVSAGMAYLAVGHLID